MAKVQGMDDVRTFVEHVIRCRENAEVFKQEAERRGDFGGHGPEYWQGCIDTWGRALGAFHMPDYQTSTEGVR